MGVTFLLALIALIAAVASIVFDALLLTLAVILLAIALLVPSG